MKLNENQQENQDRIEILNKNDQNLQNKISIISQKILKQEAHKKLSRNIKILENTEDIEFLVSTISDQNLEKLNPKSLIKFNSKKDNISVEDFKNKLKGQTNCMFIIKVKENTNSDFEFYGGFAPDSTIFNASEEQTFFKTKEIKESNFPYTFDLNTKVKRNFVNKNNNAAYGCWNYQYFQFNGDLRVLYKQNDFKFTFSYSNNQYKSQFEEENQNQKRYESQKMQEIEIEVVKLF